MLLTTGKSHQRFENFSIQIFSVQVASSACCAYMRPMSTHVATGVVRLSALAEHTGEPCKNG